MKGLNTVYNIVYAVFESEVIRQGKGNYFD